MKSSLTKLLRSRWFVAAVHCGLWVLLYFAVTNLGGKAPEFREAQAASTPVQSPAPVAKLEQLFAPGIWPKPVPDTNTLSPFFTRHFIPPPTPAPPPPPTTRKIEATYQGFYQTGDGPKHALVKLGDALKFTTIGARLTTNFFVASATMQSLTLTNVTGQTNQLLLNTKKEIEVPIP
jgi:hypothetical protein